MKIGCHLSSSGGYLAMAQTAVSIGANVFQFFTRNPRGGAAKPIDPEDVKAFLAYAEANGIGPILAHAPYTLNAAAAEDRIREFAEMTFVDDLKRLELTPGAMYNFHPGSHVGQGAEKGIELISDLLLRVLNSVPRCVSPAAGNSPVPPPSARTGADKPLSTIILLETMAGKGSEVGRSFEEIRAIIDRVEAGLLLRAAGETHRGTVKLGVCLDTCHVWDGGYDIVNDLDGVLDTFDRVIGLDRLKAIHTNDSMNVLGAHKDRHEKIGKGKIGLDAFARLVNHPKLKDLPFYLETPCDLQGYKEEIALLKSLVRG